MCMCICYMFICLYIHLCTYIYCLHLKNPHVPFFFCDRIYMKLLNLHRLSIHFEAGLFFFRFLFSSFFDGMMSFFKHFFKKMFKADSKPCTSCHRLVTMRSHPEKSQAGFQGRSRTVLNTALYGMSQM